MLGTRGRAVFMANLYTRIIDDVCKERTLGEPIMTKELETLYHAAIAADDAFQAALVKEYGKEACNKRYAAYLPSYLVVLANKKKAADLTLHMATLKMRAESEATAF
jgi:hypothetical protein